MHQFTTTLIIIIISKMPRHSLMTIMSSNRSVARQCELVLIGNYRRRRVVTDFTQTSGIGVNMAEIVSRKVCSVRVAALLCLLECNRRCQWSCIYHIYAEPLLRVYEFTKKKKVKAFFCYLQKLYVKSFMIFSAFYARKRKLL